MAYPFASFGTFLFQADETALFGSDAGWNRSPSYARSRPLGSLADTVVLLAGGSAERTFELHLSPDRFDALALLVGTVASFTDWERPTPDSRDAVLQRLDRLERLAVLCSDGTTQQRVRTSVTLVSQ